MKNEEKDLVRIQHIVKAIGLIEKFSRNVSFDQFANDLMMQSAIIRQFEIIGEASANLSDEFKESYPAIEWRTIKGFRNLLIHEYFRVDLAEVWSAIESDVPILKEQIHSMLDEN